MSEIISLIANASIVLGCTIIMLCSINFAKTKDIYHSIHFIIISNIYGISLLLIGVAVHNYKLIGLIKIITLIILNIIIVMIITGSLAVRAMKNKIDPKAKEVSLK